MRSQLSGRILRASESAGTWAERVLPVSPVGEMLTAPVNGSRRFKLHAAGSRLSLKIELLRNNNVIQTFRPKPKDRQWLRVVWADNVYSRRVDDSQTTGRLQLYQGALRVKEVLQAYNRTAAFLNRDGGIDFRNNAYSGITRGALFEIDGSPGKLLVPIQDYRADQLILAKHLEFALDELPQTQQCKLDLPPQMKHSDGAMGICLAAHFVANRPNVTRISIMTNQNLTNLSSALSERPLATEFAT